MLLWKKCSVRDVARKVIAMMDAQEIPTRLKPRVGTMVLSCHRKPWFRIPMIRISEAVTAKTRGASRLTVSRERVRSRAQSPQPKRMLSTQEKVGE